MESFTKDVNFEVVIVGDNEMSDDVHLEELKKKIGEVRNAKNSVILVNAPRSEKECYLLREAKVIPHKILYFNDDFENLCSFYQILKQNNPEDSKYLAEDEQK